METFEIAGGAQVKGRAWPPSALEEWRRRRRLSGRRLSQLVGCSANYVSLLENGRAKPSARMRDALADILQVPEELLFEPELDDD